MDLAFNDPVVQQWPESVFALDYCVVGLPILDMVRDRACKDEIAATRMDCRPRSGRRSMARARRGSEDTRTAARDDGKDGSS